MIDTGPADTEGSPTHGVAQVELVPPGHGSDPRRPHLGVQRALLDDLGSCRARDLVTRCGAGDELQPPRFLEARIVLRSCALGEREATIRVHLPAEALPAWENEWVRPTSASHFFDMITMSCERPRGRCRGLAARTDCLSRKIRITGRLRRRRRPSHWPASTCRDDPARRACGTVSLAYRRPRRSGARAETAVASASARAASAGGSPRSSQHGGLVRSWTGTFTASAVSSSS